jgi:uncharacterized membrane protein
MNMQAGQIQKEYRGVDGLVQYYSGLDKKGAYHLLILLLICLMCKLNDAVAVTAAAVLSMAAAVVAIALLSAVAQRCSKECTLNGE